MSLMRIETSTNGLTAEEAKGRMVALGEYFVNKHGLTVTWTGERAEVKGRYIITFEGVMSFEPGKAVFEGKDPGFLLRGKAKDYIGGKLAAYMDPKTKVEDLPRR